MMPRPALPLRPLIQTSSREHMHCHYIEMCRQCYEKGTVMIGSSAKLQSTGTGEIANSATTPLMVAGSGSYLALYSYPLINSYIDW
jgi:hypothetical protein